MDTDNQDTYELVYDPVQVPLYYMNVVIEMHILNKILFSVLNIPLECVVIL